MQYFVALLAMFLEEIVKSAGNEVGEGVGKEIVKSLFGREEKYNIEALMAEFANVCL